MRKSYWVWLIFCMLLAGCASTFDFRRHDIFEDTARVYERRIFWSEFETAKMFLAPDDTATRRMPSKHVRVTDYRVREVTFSDDSRKVIQLVEISYYKSDNLSIKTIMDEQVWEFVPDRGVWLLKSGFPNFD